METAKSIKRISVIVGRLTNNLLKEKGLSLTQGIVLTWLSQAENYQLSMKDIEKKLDVAQSTTLGIVNRLENKEFVTTNFLDARVKIVEITPDGLELSAFICDCIKESEAVMFQGLTQGEVMIFCELLAKIEGNLS